MSGECRKISQKSKVEGLVQSQMSKDFRLWTLDLSFDLRPSTILLPPQPNSQLHKLHNNLSNNFNLG